MLQPYLDFHLHTNYSKSDVCTIQNIYLQDYQKNRNINQPLFTCGLHPWHLDQLTLKECRNLLHGAAALPGLFAIGECGLDKNTAFALELQIDFFRMHILTAKEFHKPLIIHCVRRHGELLQILKQEKFKEAAIIHGFDSKESVAEQLLDHNLYFSFGSAILKPNHPAAKVLKTIPDDRFFLETDDFPVSIEEIYLKAAQLRDTDLTTIQKIVNSNLHRIQKQPKPNP